MKPLSKEVRRALKREYPELTDAMLDRAEALLVLRTQLDPERYEKEMAMLDQRRLELIKSVMPKYEEILAAWRQKTLAERRQSPRVRKTEVVVTPRPSPKQGARHDDPGRTPTSPVRTVRRK